MDAVSGSTIVSVFAKKGSKEQGRFALQSAVTLLQFYNQYFGVPYPLPKLDMIAALGAGGFSAMENWGAILYFEDQLLLDEEWSTEANRQRVFVVIAHEMAHQWFGDLVTMRWWDNYGSTRASPHGWRIRQRIPFTKIGNFAPSGVRPPTGDGAGCTTHPVVQPVISVEQAAFDDITYRKGRAVIRMLENYLGSDALREDVCAYMKRYKRRFTSLKLRTGATRLAYVPRDGRGFKSH